MSGLEDLEDDVELPQMAALHTEEPRKLSRLRKKGGIESPENNSVKGTDTPEGEARSTLAGAVLNGNERFEKEVSHTLYTF